MAITRFLVMICLSHNLLKWTTSSEFEEPSVQEGVPYSQNCSANLTGLFMHIQWTDKAGKSIARCKEKICQLQIMSHKYNVTVEKNNLTLTSILTNSNVTVEDRGSMLTCMVFYNNTVEKKKWKLSKTYYLPSSKCETHFIEGQAVHLSCETLKVYPGITCDIFERHNGNNRKLNSTMATKKTDFPGYFSENCSVIIYPRLPGEFEYCVNVKVKDRDNVPYKSSWMKNITIRFEPTLNIFQADGYTQLCPGKNMTMKCELLWWQSSSTPTILWYLDDKLVNSNDTQVRSSGSFDSTYNYESFYSFIPNYPNHKTRLRCEVCYEHNLQGNITKGIINATKEISLIWPSPQPEIIFIDYSLRENSTRIASPENPTQTASIYFIIPALILLFAAGIFITLVVYLKKRRTDFEIYWQGCHGNSRLCCLIFHHCAKFEYSETTSHRSRNSDKKGRKSRENTTPYAVVDIINKSDAPGTDTNFSNPTIKEPSELLQIGPLPSPGQQQHMSSFSSLSCSKLITTENDDLNISHGSFLDNCWSMKGNSGVNDGRQEETPLSSLPPPLPPRTKHGVTISSKPDSPLCEQGDNMNRNKMMHYWTSLTRPTNAERFYDDRQYFQSVPKRRPPPIPCRSNIINVVHVSSSDFCDRHNRPDCHVVHEHVESKDVSSGAEASSNHSLFRGSPDYVWPPPLTRGMNKVKTKKKRYKTRNTSEHPGIKAYHFCPSVTDDRNFKEEQTTLLPNQRGVDIVTIKSTVQHGKEIPPNKCINYVNKEQRYRFSDEGLGEINYGDWNHRITTAGCRESGSDLSLLSVVVNTEPRSSLDNDFVSDITSLS